MPKKSLRVKNANIFEMHTICKFAMNIIKLIFFRVIYICITVYISLTDQFVVGQQEEMPVCTTHM